MLGFCGPRSARQLYRKSVTCRCNIEKDLYTRSIDSAPRGVTRHDYERRGRREYEGAVEESTTPLESPLQMNIPSKQQSQPTKPKGDTRSMDKIDPVILKYTEMLNEARSSKHVDQKIHLTNFGSIRFDNDNIPLVHGQFDEPKVDGIELSLQDRFDMLDASGSDENIHKIRSNKDPDIHLRAPEVISPPESKDCINTVVENRNTDLNYIDDIFFGTTVSGFSNDASSQSHNKTQTSEQLPKTNDLNYIDDHFFGKAVANYPSLQPTDQEICSRKVINKENDISNNKSNDFETEKLNYIDEIFFKESLDIIKTADKDPVPYAEVQNDVMKSLTSNFKPDFETINPRREEILGNNTDQDMEANPHEKNISQILNQTNRTQQKKQEEKLEKPDPKTAFDYVLNMRKLEREKAADIVTDGKKKNYKKILSLLSEQKSVSFTKHEVLALLKRSILYDKNDVVGLFKPYGITMHGGTRSGHHVLTDFLPELAHYLKVEDLHLVHRLDSNTTGVLLLAKTASMATTLKDMYKEQQVKKTYWAITKGIPNPLQGIIDIPIAEGTIEGRRRMVLYPEVEGLKRSSKSSQKAVTRYQVLSRVNSSALVELNPMTGVKHQLRVHLGFGLACPVLGDHKYSHLRKLAPQRLPGDMLEYLKMKQSKVRDLPIYLHSRVVVLPEFHRGHNVIIKAKLPAFFNKTLSLLKLNRHGNQLKAHELVIQKETAL